MIEKSELKITGKTLSERVIEAFKTFIDGHVTLSDDIWAKLTNNINRIGQTGIEMFECDIVESIKKLLFEQIPNIEISDAERDVFLCGLNVIVSESYDNDTAPYFYIYVVNNHTNKAIGRYIRNYAQFVTLEEARHWRDNADDYYDAIYKVKINANGNGNIHSSYIMSIEMLNPIVEQIISNLQYEIDEHENQANNPDYDELERHDARIAAETFQSVLNFINKITNY